MKKLHLSLLFLILLQSVVFSQTNPIATDNQDIRIFPSDNPQSEVHISINKTNPFNIIVGANTYTTDYSQGHYYSQDGGITWFGSDDMPNSGVAGGDPSTSFDASGRGYIATMTNDLDGYFVQHTDDRGDTWSNQVRGVGPSSDFDKEMITTVDEMQTSPFANNFYCAWTDFNDNGLVKVNRSTNRTDSFDVTITLSDTKGQGTNIQTGPNGEVYVCWADYTNGGLPAQNMGFAFSTDGGVTYTSSTPFGYNGIRTSNGANSRFRNTRVNDFPCMAVDKSCSNTRGRIYIAYPEFEDSSNARSVIRIRSSNNQGTNWSNPVTISIDSSVQSWFPWVAVDDLTGLVNVAYYSIDSSGTARTNTFVAYSTDGGNNWQNIRVSDTSHITAPINNTLFAGGYAGDYIGITSFQASSYVAWADNRNGTWQVYVSKLDFSLPTLTSSQSNLFINNPSVLRGNRIFQAADSVVAANINTVEIDSNANIEFVAGDVVILEPGFSTQNGATFVARIDNVTPCTTPGATALKKENPWISESTIKKEINGKFKIFSYPNPASNYITVGCITDSIHKASISILDIAGKLILQSTPDYIDKTHVRKVFDTSMLSFGTYVISFTINQENISSKFIKQ